MLVISINIMRRVVLVLIFLLILGLVIAYARGYRLEGGKEIVSSRGIIAVSASPKAAKVYINGQFKGVTDINLTLPPGTYTIEVKKDGYSSWKRTVNLKGELVLTLDVLLYPLNASLTPLTNLGLLKAIPVERTGKTLIFSDNGDETKDGVYLFDQGKGPLSLLPPLKLVLLKKNLPESIDLKKTDVIFSPDLKQGIFTFYDQDNNIIVSYLLALEEENTQFFDVTGSKDVLLEAWNEERDKDMIRVFDAFPKEVRKIATDSMHIVSFSPDETKVLYQALKPVELPIAIKPRLIATNQTPEVRLIEPTRLYVYDKKEDRNYLVVSDSNWIKQFQEATSYIYWYPDSKHLLLNEGPKIVAIGYDGVDKQTVYSGPFDERFFSMTGDGGIVIMANFNPQNNLFADLYLVGIK